MIEANWFYGVVESVDDPLKQGLVQLRLRGIHEQDASLLPSEFLPWAQIMMPPTSSSNQGVGRSPTGLQVGDDVFGFAIDRTYNDLRVVASWHGKNAAGSDVNSLATSNEHELASVIESGRVLGINLGETTKVDEPSTTRSVVYPLNDVTESRAGVVRESDSSDDKARESMLHPSGSYTELQHDGKMVSKFNSWFRVVVDTTIDAFMGSKFVSVVGNYVEKVQADFYRGVTGQSTTKAGASLIVSPEVEFHSSEIRTMADIRSGGVLYIKEIRVGTLKADNISCKGTIDGIVKGAEQSGIAGGLSSVVLTPGAGAGDIGVTLSLEDKNGDYPVE